MNKNIHPNDKKKLIAESKLIESIFPNLSAKYVRFNKISLLEPREFVYLKYTNASHNYHWEICISKDSLL